MIKLFMHIYVTINIQNFIFFWKLNISIQVKKKKCRAEAARHAAGKPSGLQTVICNSLGLLIKQVDLAFLFFLKMIF